VSPVSTFFLPLDYLFQSKFCQLGVCKKKGPDGKGGAETRRVGYGVRDVKLNRPEEREAEPPDGGGNMKLGFGGPR